MKKKILKIISVVFIVVTVLVITVVPSFAYGSSEFRTDIDSFRDISAVNDYYLLVSGSLNGVNGACFLDSSTSWHTTRDYYGNGKIICDNYRNVNNIKDIEFYYLYNYYYYGDKNAYASLKYTPQTGFNVYGYRYLCDEFYLGFSKDIIHLNLNNAPFDDDIDKRIVRFNYSYYVLKGDVDSEGRYSPSYERIEGYYDVSFYRDDYDDSASVMPFSLSINDIFKNDNVAKNIGVVYDLDISVNVIHTDKYHIVDFTTSNSYQFDPYNVLLKNKQSDYLNDYYKRFYNPAPEYNSIWEMLSGAVNSFFNITLFGNITIGLLGSIALAIALFGLFLKAFAGG